MADKTVNPHFAKWADLKPNQHCHLEVDRFGNHRWRNPQGEFHRADARGVQDGPACIYGDGLQEWYLEGKLHRLDGPAVIHPDGYQEWWLDDHDVTQRQWSEEVLQRILKAIRTKSFSAVL